MNRSGELDIYPMLGPSGTTLCHPLSMAYCTDGSRKVLDASFSMVSIPSSLTSALSSCGHNIHSSHGSYRFRTDLRVIYLKIKQPGLSLPRIAQSKARIFEYTRICKVRHAPNVCIFATVQVRFQDQILNFYLPPGQTCRNHNNAHLVGR